MNELVFFLEEPSAEAMLEGLLPRIIPEGITWRTIVFEGKQDMEKRIVKRLCGYLNPGARFVILRDKDAGDCIVIKNCLKEKCIQAGKPETLVRIACHELESWYLADLAAVEKGLNLSGLARRQNQRIFRNPDQTPNPAHELQRVAPVYQKLSGSRAISPYLDVDNTRSHSFHVFVTGIQCLFTPGRIQY
jgi:hypothetical protein